MQVLDDRFQAESGWNKLLLHVDEFIICEDDP
jgi:hypothetical protein